MNEKYIADFNYPMLITVNITSDLEEFIYIVFNIIILYLKYISKENTL